MNASFVPLNEWGLPIHDLFLSAGPCSVESEEQLLSVASGLKNSGISFLRGGIWKPRTFPGSFEGVGAVGLKWLSRARKEYGLPVGTEVASPEHVEACLEHQVDVIWVGARTTPNPFAVQALADALKGVDIPVLIKNPISPDLDLWIGAIERFQKAGVTKIGAIHRGFSSVKKVLYRNAPNWKIPIELKRQFPDLPLICDPSHICGKKDLIFSIAQEALDLLFDGLMIEVHERPEEALSDSGQQVTSTQFASLINRLTVKREECDSGEYITRIKELRAEVDDIDHHLLRLMNQRMYIARKIGDLKQKNNISTYQPQRWNELIQKRLAEGKEQKLSEDFIFQLFQLIHEEAIEEQERAGTDLPD